MGSEAKPTMAADIGREQLEFERSWADRIRAAGKEERRELYSAAYDQLYKRFPFIHVDSPDKRRRRLQKQLRFVSRFVGPQDVFLEVGPGRCDLSFAMAGLCRRVIGVDVSDEVTSRPDRPANFELHISDGTSVPVAPGSVDVAFSDQLMEHLHPDDALEQLRNLLAALKPGGLYLCVTPSRHTGPHDISRSFDDRATGLHLKEYSTGELAALMRQVGFRRVTAQIGAGGWFLPAPAAFVTALEAILDHLPRPLARRLARSAPMRPLLGVRIVARK